MNWISGFKKIGPLVDHYEYKLLNSLYLDRCAQTKDHEIVKQDTKGKSMSESSSQRLSCWSFTKTRNSHNGAGLKRAKVKMLNKHEMPFSISENEKERKAQGAIMKHKSGVSVWEMQNAKSDKHMLFTKFYFDFVDNFMNIYMFLKTYLL